MSLAPEKVVASFDSASVLHAATVSALQQHAFPHLGNPPVLAALVRVAGRLPWPVLRRLYARIGGAEGIDADRLGEVDLAEVAASFADAYPGRRYPAALIGSSNGALTHLAAAMQVPWLPGTVLVPVARVADPQRPDLALEFGRRVAPALLEANPDVVLHQMHDALQDELMVARMSYFRTKWRTLPDAYAAFLGERLEPGAPVLLVEDRSTWPVTRLGDRHVFQTGGRGGSTPEQYLSRPFAPQPDDEAPEAEWGADPGFTAAVQAWCAANGHPCVVLSFEGPQDAAAPVASVLREWTAERGGDADRLLVPSFVLGDPWRTIEIGRVPFWTFFPVEPAFESLDRHLAAADPPYATVEVMLFQHGAHSPGVVMPDAAASLIRRHGARPRLVAVDPRRSPHDIGSLARYGPLLARVPEAALPFRRLPVATVARRLAEIPADGGAPLVAPA